MCLLAGLFEKPAESPRQARRIRTSPLRLESVDRTVSAPSERGARRPVYPYSVIPGGIVSGSELVNEMSRDPVVAQHYSDFRPADARMVRARDEKLVHVSYRIGNRVFWTAKKLRLARGEALVTDGRSLARARCGNRLSVLAQEPTLPEEPPAAEFETPVFPERTEDVIVNTLLEPGPMDLFPDLGRRVPTLPLYLNPPLSSRNLNPPVIPPLVPAAPQPHVVPPPKPPADTPEVPEPGTLVLLGTGLAIAALCRFASKRRVRSK